MRPAQLPASLPGLQSPRRPALAARREEAAARRAAGLLPQGALTWDLTASSGGRSTRSRRSFRACAAAGDAILNRKPGAGEPSARGPRRSEREEAGGRRGAGPTAPPFPPPRRSRAPGPLRPAPPLFVVRGKDWQKWVLWLYIPFGLWDLLGIVRID